MIYLGSLGRMVGLKCPASQQLTVEDLTSFESTLEGRKIARVPHGTGRRSWQCQLADASKPDQVGAVMSFINREWGIGPFVFVSADAPVTNLLTPSAASCSPEEAVIGSGASISAYPPMGTPDGLAGRSYLKSTENAVFFGERLPVPPSGMVTASAYVLGAGGAVRISWYNSSGGGLGTVTSSVKSTAGSAVRSYISALPPADAVSFLVSANSNTTQVCRPAATWSDSLLGWADGQGCSKAIIHGASRELIMASREPSGGRYSNLSFTISEVG